MPRRHGYQLAAVKAAAVRWRGGLPRSFHAPTTAIPSATTLARLSAGAGLYAAVAVAANRVSLRADRDAHRHEVEATGIHSASVDRTNGPLMRGEYAHPGASSGVCSPTFAAVIAVAGERHSVSRLLIRDLVTRSCRLPGSSGRPNARSTPRSTNKPAPQPPAPSAGASQRHPLGAQCHARRRRRL